MILYNLRRTGDGYTMCKFDDDFNVAAVYNLTPAKNGALACDCPAGPRPTCRHRKMVPVFVKAGTVDTMKFYNYERQFWHEPIPADGLGDASAEKAVEAVTKLSEGVPEAKAKAEAPAPVRDSIRRV